MGICLGTASDLPESSLQSVPRYKGNNAQKSANPGLASCSNVPCIYIGRFYVPLGDQDEEQQEVCE